MVKFIKSVIYRSHYENNQIIDGIKWCLKIMYKNGEIKEYFGKNNFPSNFEYLDKIKDEMIYNLYLKKGENDESFRY